MCDIIGDGLCDDVVRGAVSLKRADWALRIIKEPECLPKEFGFYSVGRKNCCNQGVITFRYACQI